ncbi:MAG: hypothetical protein HUN05_05370 [Desulfobacter sp.]|nr:MAG: hypothetical protein HUN05_05370 [Desulfobacter sp.]
MKFKKHLSLAVFIVFTALVIAEFHNRWIKTSGSDSHQIRYLAKANAQKEQVKKKSVDYSKLIEAAGKIRQ